MKKTLLFLVLLIGIQAFGQSPPQFINYQAILRDVNNVPLAAGTAITLNFKIYNTFAGPIAYEEDHVLTIPTSSVVNVRIGTGNPIPSNGSFSNVIWSTNAVHYMVSVNGTTISARQPFASVPYALNAGGSSTSYSPSSNVSTTGNILDLTNTSVISGPFGSNIIPNSKVPMFTVDQKGRLTQAGEYAANLGGDIIGKLDSQYVSKLRGAPLSTVFPTAGQVLQFNSGFWVPSNLSGSGPWTYNSGVIFPSNNTQNDKVAIGTNASPNLLNVINNGGTTITAVPVANFLNSNSGFNASGVVSISNQSGSGAALFVQNTNSPATSDGIVVNLTAVSNGNDGIRVSQGGVGKAGNFISSNNSATTEVLSATSIANIDAIKGTNNSVANNSLAIGVHGKTGNAHPNATGVWGENTGNGSGVVGTTSANVAGVVGVNFSGANANATGVYGMSSSNATTSIGVFGESKASGYGVYGINSSTLTAGVNGVYGTTTGTFNTNAGVFGETNGAANGVRGINKGSGNSVLGSKPLGATGFAGRFEILDNTNTSAALFAITQGTGAAVQAQAGAPASSALALLVQNGHIKSTGSSPTFTPGNVSGFPTPSFNAPSVSGTDVKGAISVIFAYSGAVLSSGAFFELGINFNKPYGAVPIVVVTPTSDMQGLDFEIVSVSQTSFFIRVYRTNNLAVATPGTIPSSAVFNFNYIVIE